MSTDLAAFRNAIATTSTGHQVNEDSWMTMWCSTNWGNLLQPAPLSIALLGSIMVISASTDDFSLVNADDPVQYQWKYATHPGSFKACLMQMVNEGYTAFGTAHKSMTRIQNASGQIPDVIKDAVAIIIQGSPKEVDAYLPDQLQSALDLAQICAAAAKETEDGFHGIWNLASEMVVGCTNQVGTTEQKLQANNVQLQVLQQRKEAQEDRVTAAKEANDLMKKSFENAEDNFNHAVKNVPSGWDLVGMQVVENLSKLAVTAGNAAISIFTLKEQAAMAGIGMLKTATGTGPPDGKTGQDNGNTGDKAPVQSAEATKTTAATLTDPGNLEVTNVQGFVGYMQQLVAGGPDQGPNWDMIRAGGGVFIQTGLEAAKGRLEGDKPISAELLPLIETALSAIKKIIDIGHSAEAGNAKALDEFKTTIDTLKQSLADMVTKTNLNLQQTGNPATGPATPPTPSMAEKSSSASQLAVENSKLQVDQTRANLEASRTAYNNATQQLLQQKEDISKTIAQLTSLKLTNAGLQAMLPVLKTAVGAFTTLQAQFSQITQFFESVASLLKDVLQPSVSRWANTMENTMSLAGVSLSALTRQLIYTQMMLPLRVSMLSTKIAGTYLEVSNLYILPAQRSVGSMMQFSSDTSDQGKAALQAKLATAQAQLQHTSDEASTHIADLVTTDQKTFAASIDKRLSAIQAALQPVLPEIAQPGVFIR
ncbi:hypothetical protein VNI00_003176 [Paramarasmius palmivorus]|uniref:Uncharacterized protein n=1 Tax=Paramarasmius palmivorus TaxID=297713 RepID=A0AAW0DTB3_9AGAR